MTREDLQDLPLAELFLRATSIVRQLESKPSPAPETRQFLQEGIRLLRLASQLVEAAGLFSPNEDKDDLATADLRYLLVPYYLGELLSQADPGDPGAKRSVLGSAQQQYMAYLQRVRQYDLLGREASALLAQLEEVAGSSSSSSRASGVSNGNWRPDPAELRQNKIMKFKREKQIKARLEALNRRQGEQGTAAGAAAAADGDGAAGPGVGFSDEVEEREVWLLQLDLAALQAAEKVGILRQEMELLAHAASLPEEEGDKPPPAAPSELRQKLLAAAGALQGKQRAACGGGRSMPPGPQREQLRQAVFRPSHALPTMTVEQWGEVELRAAREQQAAEEARERREQTRRAGMSAEELEDEEVDKQRAWDDWKDANPTGWGNSKLRPCG
ncbi:hypothetical protein N2152v2_010975 [Parachlorella kessleri]